MKLQKVKQMALCMQRYSWEQGSIAQAFLECGDEDTAILMAREACFRQLDDGRTAMMGVANAITDPCSIGEVLLFAYDKTGDMLFKDSSDRLLEWALYNAPRTDDGLVYHLLSQNELWADSFYMLPPFLVAAGEYDEALKQLDGYWNIFYRQEGGMLAHKWDDDTKTFSRGVLWSEGNGWAIAAMARVIDMLPETYANKRDVLIQHTKTLIINALKYIRDDYFFHDVVDDPATCVENGFSQLLAYGIYRGISSEWLDDEYLSFADGIYDAMQNKVDEFGVVNDVCSAKSGFIKPGPVPEGQAFYMLMCAARANYLDAK